MRPVPSRLDYALRLAVCLQRVEGRVAQHSRLRGTVVERWSLTGELCPSCARPTADGRGTVVERWSLTGELCLSCARPTANG